MQAVITLRGLVLIRWNLAAPKETGMDQKAIQVNQSVSRHSMGIKQGYGNPNK